MEWGEIKDAVILVLMFIVFGMPAVAIAARIAVKPIVDAIARLRELGLASTPAPPDPRIPQLEAQMAQLRAEVRHLSEAESFHRELSRGERP